ncbi:CATRA conflict system CASPASE/TPR repeat-associated protein [Streptomyces sp. NBC_01451]|uniref:CATRA conflict system CASPASE/TPR repeat-associated protein n=1 Tax=Streptomyces sp. NBC_01451 TaxID=2903872 RepID=UPI002E37A51A|nr:CATRA conflict system CASPASE/TPR repeat-associated protein [Streptomyces sp. NBC_01451]
MTAPGWIDEETRTDVLEVLGDLLAWELTPQRWERVEPIVVSLAEALAAGDGAAARDATADLELAGPVRATRLGAVPVIPVPEHIRDQADHLVHSLDAAPQGPTGHDSGSTGRPGGGDGGATPQELVVHLYASLDGPFATAGYQQIRGVWERCRDGLGMVGPIAGTGLPDTLPSDAATLVPGRAAAAQEDPAADFQAVVRREHDVVNLSIVFAAPLDTPARRRRIGSASPPGWAEFDRWWTGLASDGTDALLGSVRVYQARFPGSATPPLHLAADEVERALSHAGHVPGWGQRGWTTERGFAVWELSRDDVGPARSLVVLAPEDQQARLSAWTWSQGQPAMPLLARYLMHAAKLRYQARVRGDGQEISRLREQVHDRTGRLPGLSRQRSADLVAELAELRGEEARLTLVEANVRDMLHTVRISVDNMTGAEQGCFAADRRLAEWLPRQLGHDAEYLASTRSRARDLRCLLDPESVTDGAMPVRAPASGPPVRGPVADPSVPPFVPSQSAAPPAVPRPVTPRLGFAVDAEGYSGRTSPQQDDVQDRLARLVREVLAGVGLALEDTDHQGTGDGMNVFLPPGVELHRALPPIIRSWKDHLAADNGRFRDRLRLRLATVVGPAGVAALGYSGATIVEVSRMLNSDVLRGALRENPRADYTALVSDQLYQYVVGEGHPGLDAKQFQRVLVETKEYSKHAWLWIPG